MKSNYNQLLPNLRETNSRYYEERSYVRKNEKEF